MSPASIICQAQADGVRLALTAAGSIKASGDGAAIERWLAVLRSSKAELVELLRRQAEPAPPAQPTRAIEDTATVSAWWLLHYADRDPVQMVSCPPATLAQVLKHRPDVLAAEPISEPHPEPALAAVPVGPKPVQPARQDCRTCLHKLPYGTCAKPVAAGLMVGGPDRFGIRWPPKGHGAACPAFQPKPTPGAHHA